VINSDANSSDDHDFIAKVIASPETLLTLCIRSGNFKRCTDIIKRFRLDGSVSTQIALAEATVRLEEQLRGSWGGSSAINLKSLASTDALEAAAVCLDFASTSSGSLQIAKMFLDQAQAQLETQSFAQGDRDVDRYWMFAACQNLRRRHTLLYERLEAKRTLSNNNAFYKQF